MTEEIAATFKSASVSDLRYHCLSERILLVDTSEQEIKIFDRKLAKNVAKISLRSAHEIPNANWLIGGFYHNKIWLIESISKSWNVAAFEINPSRKFTLLADNPEKTKFLNIERVLNQTPISYIQGRRKKYQKNSALGSQNTQEAQEFWFLVQEEV